MNRFRVRRGFGFARRPIAYVSANGQLRVEAEQRNPAATATEPAAEPASAQIAEQAVAVSGPVEQGSQLPVPGSQKAKRGRKSLSESQAEGIRARLVAWKQTPEAQRVSLRALAVELGTSHQLLSFYLKGLNDWQKKDYRRRAKAIRDRTEAENRYMTPWEESQVKALERAAFHCMIDSVLQPTLKRLEADAGQWFQAGTKLSRLQLRAVKALDQMGVPIARKILEKHRNNLPPQPPARR
jgi:hypothetical protein